ncbi:MAG: PsiF family protein [Pseudomonadota bacterium]
MKLLSTLTIAALMASGTAFAATTPTATAGATATPVAAPAKHEGGMHCAREAKEKKLTGDAEKTFVKECKEGKKAN